MVTWTAQFLSSLASHEIQAKLPVHLQQLIQKAIDLLHVSRIIIYGSRARGDARENSDFDLAFIFPNKQNWAEFTREIQEESPSLYHYDLVDLDKCDLKLIKKILDEGIIIYDSKT